MELNYQRNKNMPTKCSLYTNRMMQVDLHLPSSWGAVNDDDISGQGHSVCDEQKCGILTEYIVKNINKHDYWYLVYGYPHDREREDNFVKTAALHYMLKPSSKSKQSKNRDSAITKMVDPLELVGRYVWQWFGHMLGKKLFERCIYQKCYQCKWFADFMLFLTSKVKDVTLYFVWAD